MTTLDDITKEQKAIAEELKIEINSYNKDPTRRKSTDFLKQKLLRATNIWQKFEENDTLIRTKYGDKLDHAYFASSCYDSVYTAYEDLKEDIERRLQSVLNTPINPSGAADSRLEMPGIPCGPGSNGPGAIKQSKGSEEKGAIPKKLVMPGISCDLGNNGPGGMKESKGNEKEGAIPKNLQPTISGILQKQNTILNLLHRTLEALTPVRAYQTEFFYRTKAQTIQRYLQEAQSLHNIIWSQLDDPTTAGYDCETYFTLEESAENKIIELHQYRNDHQLDPRLQQPTASQIPNTMSVMKLPKIVLPKFDGDYLKWRQFRDLFTELVHNQSIADCQKMWYLKTSVSGEAEKLIRHLTVSDINYKAAWKVISDRYENNRLLTTAFLNKFLTQPAFTSESATLIKNLHDTTQECLLGLQNLGIKVATWDTIILHILLKKIDKGTHALYEQSLDNPRNLPSLKEFLAFLETRFQSLEALGSKPRSQEEHPKRSVNSAIASEFSCTLCNNPHQLYACSKFLQLSPLCVNCLKKGHKFSNCPARSCTKCKKKHNTLLHIDVSSNIKAAEDTQITSVKRGEILPAEKNVSLAARMTEESEKYVLLGTAMVTLVGNHGKSVTCRALLDGGSQLNLVSERVAKKLSLTERNKGVTIEGVNKQLMLSAKRVNILVQSQVNNFSMQVEANVLPQIVSQQPARNLNIESWPIPKNIVLADSGFNEPATIDFLLGAGVFYSLLSVGQIELGDELPILQNTRLGWIVAGPTTLPSPDSAVCGMCSETETLDAQIERFWSLEEKEDSSTNLTAEEQRCETFFIQTTQKGPDGRFIVNFPFIDHPHSLGESSGMAYQRLKSLEKRMTRDEEFRTLYTQFMEEYIRLGHMEEVDINNIEAPYCFLPHHGVLKPESSTTKLRVVFDASAQTSSGKSLNDILSKGPAIQDDVFSILLRFRMPRYVFTADIEKMYRQIWINKADRKYQLIWWRENPNLQARCYQLCTITYGTTSAPYLAIRCLKRLADEYANIHPLGAKILKRDFYVDDVLAGANTISEAVESQRQLNAILQQTGFRLRKWCANHPSLLEGIASEDREVEITLGDDESGHVKTIGLSWNPTSDHFHIRTPIHHSRRITKRIILSDIAHLFDPLGIITPVIVTAKIFLQTLWAQKLDWDAALPQEMHTFWETYRNQLSTLNKIKFPRHVLAHKTAKGVQYHIFSDASEKAYGAAAYVRAVDRNGVITAHLLCAKSKVAPRKQTTLPRLELCAAKVAAELAHRIKQDLQLQEEQIHLWSDSTIVLAWINSSTSTFHTFVANRVSRIQELTIPTQWRHVSSQHNPADLLSRGVPPAKLVTSALWFYGPIFLHGNESQWPAPLS